MLISKIEVKGVHADVTKIGTMTCGMVGAKVQFTFDNSWDGLSKTAVFRSMDITKDVLNIDSEVTIPHEVLTKPGYQLCVGVYGTNVDGTLVIPTVWATVGIVYSGADPSGDPSTERSPEVWEQLQAQINELKEQGVDADTVREAVEAYLVANPLAETDPTVPEWAKQPEPPKVEIPEVDIPDNLPNPHKLTFTGAVEAEYDGSKEVTVEIPEGGGGIEVTGAEVGQTIVVKAVDDNGKPTEWECAELYQELPVLFSITLAEATTTLEITTDSEGNALSLDEWDVIVRIPGTTTYEPKIYIYAVDGDIVGWSFAFAYNDKGANNVLRYRSHGTNFIEAMACKYTTAAYNQHWMKYFDSGVHSSGIKIYTYNSGNTPMPVGTYIEIRGK